MISNFMGMVRNTATVCERGHAHASARVVRFFAHGGPYSYAFSPCRNFGRSRSEVVALFLPPCDVVSVSEDAQQWTSALTIRLGTRNRGGKRETRT